MEQEPISYPTVLTVNFLSGEDVYDGNAGAWSVDEVRINRTYTNKVRVFTPAVDGRYVGAIQIIRWIQINIGDSYEFPLFASDATENDTGSFVQSIEVAPEPGSAGLQWIATISYGPFDVAHQLGTSDIYNGIINPLDAVPEVYWSKAKYKRSKTEDESEEPQPFLNTVGDPLLNPPEFEETRPVLTIVRNESTYNDAYASQYKDTTNSDEFLGYPPNTVKCSDINGEERIYDADWGYYFKVKYIFEFRDDDDGNGYTEQVLNAGYRQLVGGVPTQITINGQAITDAVPLTKAGVYTPTAEPYFLSFKMFPDTEFSELNIPDDILDQNT